MSATEAFLIGGGMVHRLIGPRGETPPCPQSKFKRGDVVRVRNTKALANFPREAVVAVAIPPGFSPDHALADLVCEPRPLMAQIGARTVNYILIRENDPTPYLARERDLLPSGKPPVEIGKPRRETEAEAHARANGASHDSHPPDHHLPHSSHARTACRA
jgi:hypothetical protein